MSSCNFEKLVSLLDKQLDLDTEIDVLSHIDECGICHEALCSIVRDRDEDLFIAAPSTGDTTHTGRGAEL
jgi:hypothetical protein